MGGHLQRHRFPRTAALAWPAGGRRRRRRRRGGHALHSRARHAAHFLRARPGGLPLLSHPRRPARRPVPRPVQRAGRPGLHRTQAEPRRLRPRDLPDAQGIRAHFQPRGRHGQRFPGRRAGPRPQGRRANRRWRPRWPAATRAATRSVTGHSPSTGACSATAIPSACRPVSGCCCTSSTAAPPKPAAWHCPGTPST